jgi:hypothetical protein
MRPGFFHQLMTALGGQKPALARSLEPFLDEGDEGEAPLRQVSFRSPWSDEVKAAVWQKGLPIVGWDPAEWRMDQRGNPLFRLHYRDEESAFGWEIVRTVSLAHGGSDDLSNLRPQRCGGSPAADSGSGIPLDLDPYRR